MRKLICRLFGHKYTITAYLNGLPALQTCKRCHVDRIIGPGGVKILQQRKNKSGSDALAYVTSMTRRQTVTDRYAFAGVMQIHPKIYVPEDLTE